MQEQTSAQAPVGQDEDCLDDNASLEEGGCRSNN